MKDFWFIGFVLFVVSRSVIEKKFIFEPLYKFLLKLNIVTAQVRHLC